MAEAKMAEYVSQRSFSLNFDDKSPSAVIRKGDVLAYDGVNVAFPRMGNEVKGRTVHLSRAISLGWLLLKEAASPSQAAIATVTKEIPDLSPAKAHGETADNTTPQKGVTYDSLRGGNFDSFMSPKKANFSAEVVTDDSRLAKKTGPVVSSGAPAAGKKMAVISDSDAVGNHEEELGKTKSGTKIIRSNDQDGVIAIRGTKATQSAAPAKKNSFVVDDTTPRLPEFASKEEVERALTKQPLEPQEARVIRKTGKVVVDEVDGVTLKTSVGSGDQPIDASVKVRSGGTDVVDLSGVSTQEQADAAGAAAVVTPSVEDDPEMAKLAAEQAASGASAPVAKEEPVKFSPENTKEFLAKLPETWAKMHWAQKEKFVNSLTDMNFIRYIMTVEDNKTIQRICKARLQALKAAQAPKE